MLLNEQEIQRTEELSSHGLAPEQAAAAAAAAQIANNSLAGATERTFSTKLAMQLETAHNLHKAALLAATFEVSGYIESTWHLESENERHYSASLVLEPSGNDSQSVARGIELVLNNLFTNDIDGCIVQSTLSVLKGTASAELQNDVLDKIQTLFVTTLR